MLDDQLNEICCEQLRQIQEEQSNNVKQKQADFMFDGITRELFKLLETEDQKVQSERNLSLALQHSTKRQLQSHQKRHNIHLNKKSL